jgi:hypothetical protein
MEVGQHRVVAVALAQRDVEILMLNVLMKPEERFALVPDTYTYNAVSLLTTVDDRHPQDGDKGLSGDQVISDGAAVPSGLECG